MGEQDRRRTIVEEWRTIAVSPLAPGWLLIFGGEDGGEVWETAEPCPAVLLQELICEKVYEDEPSEEPDGPPWRRRLAWERHTENRSRIVAASWDSDELVPASDSSTFRRIEHRSERPGPAA